MLAHRLRRWPNIDPALSERLAFAGWTDPDLIHLIALDGHPLRIKDDKKIVT